LGMHASKDNPELWKHRNRDWKFIPIQSSRAIQNKTRGL
jgi:hypothetical protein